MNKEPLVTIPKSEYDELIKIKTEFIDAFNNNKMILKHGSWFSGMSGYPINEYAIVHESVVIAGLNKELQEVKEENNKLYDSNRKLQEVHKKWWEHIPKKKWYQLIPMK